ncbi:hypothetical protein IscW_ISCW016655 [Ixodes scapularis]|uniref:Uncharacterized protein n=1 Tax=Ixodes scapularis TaxID=6945 RepID=B7P8P3_IXOSC|nr:hypothetical protein IscW_ISCW016655 [Ixodes scapularis]|eukprot:XP_002402527.1 hypothetical protein IscW_ISCW016655 [Ixodes scapularis]
MKIFLVLLLKYSCQQYEPELLVVLFCVALWFRGKLRPRPGLEREVRVPVSDLDDKWKDGGTCRDRGRRRGAAHNVWTGQLRVFFFLIATPRTYVRITLSPSLLEAAYLKLTMERHISAVVVSIDRRTGEASRPQKSCSRIIVPTLCKTSCRARSRQH